jgi:hypothetical protein
MSQPKTPWTHGVSNGVRAKNDHFLPSFSSTGARILRNPRISPNSCPILSTETITKSK